MVHNQPLRLNEEWVVSNNRHIYLIYLDDKICGYLKHEEDAHKIILSLGKNIEEELKKERGSWYNVYSETIEDTGHPIKIVIYEQQLGRLVNSSPVARHTLTYKNAYKCYYLQESEVAKELGVKVVEEVEVTEDEVVEEEVIEETEEGVEDETEEGVEDETEEGVEDETEEGVEDETEEEVEDETEDEVEDEVEDETEDEVEEQDTEEESDSVSESFETRFEKKASKLIEKFVSFLDNL